MDFQAFSSVTASAMPKDKLSSRMQDGEGLLLLSKKSSSGFPIKWRELNVINFHFDRFDILQQTACVCVCEFILFRALKSDGDALSSLFGLVC